MIWDDINAIMISDHLIATETYLMWREKKFAISMYSEEFGSYLYLNIVSTNGTSDYDVSE
jgi:hypothetical protein